MQEQILDYISNHPGSSLSQIKAGAETSPATVNSALPRLVRDGLIKRAGKPRHYRYSVTAEAPGFTGVTRVNGAPAAEPLSRPAIVSEVDAAIAALQLRIDALQEAVRILRGLRGSK